MNIDELVGLFKNLKISEKTVKSFRFGLFSRIGDGKIKLVVKTHDDRKTPKRLIQKNAFDADKVEKISKTKKIITNQKTKRSHESDTDQELKPITIKKVKFSEKTKTTGFAKAFQARQTLSNDINKSVVPKETAQKIISTRYEPVFSQPKNTLNRYKNYNLDLFFFRIINWVFDWFEEEETQKSTPPVVDDSELTPLVDRYLSFDDYCKTMFPLLLLEIWEDISRSWHEMKFKNNEITVIWFQMVTKYDQAVELVFQTIVDFNKARAITEEDLLGLELEVLECENKTKKFLKLFGIVKRLLKLKSNDESILDEIKIKLKDSLSGYKNDISKQNNVHVYQVRILVQNCNYTMKAGEKIIIQKVSSLASTLRRVRALLKFKELNYHSKLLNPDKTDSIFSLSQNDAQDKMQFQNDEFNESQMSFMLEAASIFEFKTNEPKFYFIQGPPGTGKSHTIIGIIRTMFKNFRKNSNKLRILVCSPSNGGCDELTRRLKFDVDNDLIQIDNKEFGLVRVGRIESIHNDCDSILLEKLAAKKATCFEKAEKSDSLTEHYEAMKKMQKDLENKIRNAKNGNQVKELKEENLNDLLKKKKKLELQLEKINIYTGVVPNHKIFKYKESIMKEASIIVSTLNYSGNQIFNSLCADRNDGKSVINAIIIDETSQCLECDCLIPLRFGCNKIILVGDPEQLPATVLSKKAQEMGFNQSLFERVYQCFKFYDDNPIKMLSIQYRMHPDICNFPSKQFYKGKLITDSKSGEERASNFPFKPYLIFNLSYGQEIDSDSEGAIFNIDEANFALSLCEYVSYEHVNSSIGIITPYQKQVQYLKDLLAKKRLDNVEVGTVDSFQGREKDLIILSCVRANSSTGTIGFLSNRQRLNVSLTRAKYSLFIICNKKSLNINEDWNACIKDAQERDKIIDIENKEHVLKFNFYLKK